MMNEDFEKVIYIEKIVYKRAIPEYQKRAFKKYIESDKGRLQSRKNQKAYYERQKLKKSLEKQES